MRYSEEDFEMIERLKCSKKVRYQTKKRARRAVAAMTVPGLVFRQYRCKYCGGYHMASRPKSKGRGNVS